MAAVWPSLPTEAVANYTFEKCVCVNTACHCACHCDCQCHGYGDSDCWECHGGTLAFVQSFLFFVVVDDGFNANIPMSFLRGVALRCVVWRNGACRG